MSDWQPIETAPTHVSHNQIVLARFWSPADDSGEQTVRPECFWAHVAYPTASGWQTGTGGFKGVHGFASFPLSHATHWMPLPEGPAA